MRKLFFILILLFLPSFCCLAKSDTCERLASFQSIIDVQRTNADALIVNSNLSDSVHNKPYCVFYISGCRGIGGWVIVINNGQTYQVYYTDSFISAKKNLYKTLTYSKDDEEMQLLFSQASIQGTKMQIDCRWTLSYYYFGLFDNKGNLLFDWNQSLRFHDVQTQKRIMRVCIKLIMPFIV